VEIEMYINIHILAVIGNYDLMLRLTLNFRAEEVEKKLFIAFRENGILLCCDDLKTGEIKAAQQKIYKY
jgi:hypothetical protein